MAGRRCSPGLALCGQLHRDVERAKKNSGEAWDGIPSRFYRQAGRKRRSADAGSASTATDQGFTRITHPLNVIGGSGRR